jgi:Tfp pilus assembly protein PilO
VNRRAPLIAGGVFAVLAVLAVVLLVLPKMGQVADTEDQLAAAEDQELSLRAQLAALQDAQAAAPETERQIALIEDQIPPIVDLPALFRLLQGAADAAAIDFFSFSPGAPLADATGQLSVIQCQVTVNGGYFAIDEFLFRMETLPRAAKVTNIAVTPSDVPGGTTTITNQLQMVMTIEFYTTDTSAGPASVPGPTEGAGTVGPTGATGPATEPTDTGAQ